MIMGTKENLSKKKRLGILGESRYKSSRMDKEGTVAE